MMSDIIATSSMDNNLPALAVADTHSGERSMQRSLHRGLLVLGILVFVLGALAIFIPMQGAVIAQGQFMVETRVKHIGHPTGGVIADILVREGDRVKAGQELLRLDDTVSGATATLTGENYDQLLARAARLKAEREGLSRIIFPPELTVRTHNPSVRRLMTEEQRLLALRTGTASSQKQQFVERVRQAEAQISGLQQQLSANREQAALIDKELQATRELWSKGYTTLARLNQVERTAVDLKSQSGAMNANIASTRAQIAEIRGQILTVDSNLRSSSGTELTEVETQLAEMQRNKIAAQDTVNRVSIRAPQSGTVDKLAFSTVGGVIPPGETILDIVPDSDALVVEAQISPRDVDQVHQNQRVLLQMSAFNTRTTPEVEGVVETVSANRITDPRNGASYYIVRIRPNPQSLTKAGNLELRAGMPVEAFIQTGERSLMAYITKPLMDQLRRAFREN